MQKEIYDINQDKKEIAKLLQKYITCIFQEYKEIIPIDVRKMLENISNFEDIIHIENTGTISLFVYNNQVFLPNDAYKVLKSMAKIPGFGLNKNHQTHNSSNMIINDNTYLTFVKHVFLKGLSPVEYFKEILLHETMHLCGSSGAYALYEGFNELKTREIALKYHLETSCCGYPKETKIAYELQQLFGKEICDKLTFASNIPDRLKLLEIEIGYDAVLLYSQVLKEMQLQFEPYMSKKYPGMLGIKNKCAEYAKINYSKVYELIKQYQIKYSTRSLEDEAKFSNEAQSKK